MSEFLPLRGLPSRDKRAEAARLLPPGFDTSYTGAYEIGDTFQYVAGNGDPSSTNFYNGVSAPGPTPGAGLAGLAFLVIAGALTRARGFLAR